MRPILIAALCALLSPSSRPAPLRVSAPPATLQPGSVILLTVSSEDPVPALRARAFNRELAPFQVDGRTWQVLVGIDLDQKAGTYPVEIDAGGPQSRIAYALAVTPRRFPTRTLKVDPDLVNPPPQEMARIAQTCEAIRPLQDQFSQLTGGFNVHIAALMKALEPAEEVRMRIVQLAEAFEPLSTLHERLGDLKGAFYGGANGANGTAELAAGEGSAVMFYVAKSA